MLLYIKRQLAWLAGYLALAALANPGGWRLCESLLQFTR